MPTPTPTPTPTVTSTVDGDVDTDGDGDDGVPPMPVTSPLPPSKTTSEQLKKFSWLSERTHWMNRMCRPVLPAGRVVFQSSS